jgi:hypothetical protein
LQGSVSEAAAICFPFLLTMPTSNPGRDLTQDEQILHHHAAMIKKDLEAYHAYSRSQSDWKDLFKNRLACFILAIHFYQPFIFIQTESMDFYVDARNRNSNRTIRVHPLLLSLTEAVNASETNPDISTISENDERALRSNFYTSPSEMPPLEIHSSGQNGPSLLSNIPSYALMSVDGCRKCMGFAPQHNSGEEGNATQGNLLNYCGPKVAGVIRRPKGKQAQKAGLWGDNPLPPEEKFSEERRDRETDPRMFTGVPV